MESRSRDCIALRRSPRSSSLSPLSPPIDAHSPVQSTGPTFRAARAARRAQAVSRASERRPIPSQVSGVTGERVFLRRVSRWIEKGVLRHLRSACSMPEPEDAGAMSAGNALAGAEASAALNGGGDGVRWSDYRPWFRSQVRAQDARRARVQASATCPSEADSICASWQRTLRIAARSSRVNRRV